MVASMRWRWFASAWLHDGGLDAIHRAEKSLYINRSVSNSPGKADPVFTSLSSTSALQRGECGSHVAKLANMSPKISFLSLAFVATAIASTSDAQFNPRDLSCAQFFQRFALEPMDRVDRAISLFPPVDLDSEFRPSRHPISSAGRLLDRLNSETIQTLAPGRYDFVIPPSQDGTLTIVVGRSHRLLGEWVSIASGEFVVGMDTSGQRLIRWISLRAGAFRSPLSAFRVVLRALQQNQVFPESLELRHQDSGQRGGDRRVLVMILGTRVQGTQLLRDLIAEAHP